MANFFFGRSIGIDEFFGSVDSQSIGIDDR